MIKSSNVYARIEPDLKEQAEGILAALGSRMTAAQLDAELEKGCADVKAGRTVPMEQAFANVRKESGV